MIDPMEIDEAGRSDDATRLVGGPRLPDGPHEATSSGLRGCQGCASK
jgi:hypothetical protein